MSGKKAADFSECTNTRKLAFTYINILTFFSLRAFIAYSRSRKPRVPFLRLLIDKGYLKNKLEGRYLGC